MVFKKKNVYVLFNIFHIVSIDFTPNKICTSEVEI